MSDHGPQYEALMPVAAYGTIAATNDRDGLRGSIHSVSRKQPPVTGHRNFNLAPFPTHKQSWSSALLGNYFTATSPAAIFSFQISGPVLCTDSPWLSTATVTGISSTWNS